MSVNKTFCKIFNIQICFLYFELAFCINLWVHIHAWLRGYIGEYISMLGIRKYIFMLARKFGKCIRSTLNSCLGRNLKRKKPPQVKNKFQMERWHPGIFHFWNILPDNQNLRGQVQLKKRTKPWGQPQNENIVPPSQGSTELNK